jgi:hypothetical protein
MWVMHGIVLLFLLEVHHVAVVIRGSLCCCYPMFIMLLLLPCVHYVVVANWYSSCCCYYLAFIMLFCCFTFIVLLLIEVYCVAIVGNSSKFFPFLVFLVFGFQCVHVATTNIHCVVNVKCSSCCHYCLVLLLLCLTFIMLLILSHSLCCYFIFIMMLLLISVHHVIIVAWHSLCCWCPSSIFLGTTIHNNTFWVLRLAFTTTYYLERTYVTSDYLVVKHMLFHPFSHKGRLVAKPNRFNVQDFKIFL